MFKRLALIALISLGQFASPAQADPVPLAQLSDYFNGLKTAQGRFVQFNSDGSQSPGTLYIHRPGRMRFEYDPPNEALVLAGSGVVAIFDAKSNAEPQQFPLRRTPLNLILQRKVDFAGSKFVSDYRETETGLTSVLARDPENPDSGTIELFFTPRPVALKQWIVTDETGSRTAVVLDDLETGQNFPVSLFSVHREKEKRAD